MLPHLGAIAIFLLISIIYCKPALEGKVLNAHDNQGWKGMAQQSFEHKEKYGRFPLWTNSMFGGVPVIPTMSTGATDGYRLRAAGIPTYGVSGIFSSPGETNAHGRDEKLRIKSFYDGLAFLYELVKQVSSDSNRAFRSVP